MNFRRIIQRAAEIAALRSRQCALEGDTVLATSYENSFRAIHRWRLHRQRLPDVLAMLVGQPLSELYRQRDAILSRRADLRLELIRARVARDEVTERRFRAELVATDEPLQVLRWDIDQVENAPQRRASAH